MKKKVLREYLKNREKNPWTNRYLEEIEVTIPIKVKPKKAKKGDK